MNNKKLLAGILAIGMAVSLCACGGNDGGSSTASAASSESYEDDFIWENDTVINGLTEQGMNKKELVIPAKCTGFDGALYAEGSKVETVSWETSVSSDFKIGAAFELVPGLKKIVLPEGLEDLGGFINNCSDLEEVVFPSTLKTLGTNAVAYNPALKEVDLSNTQVESIGDYAFTYDNALTKVTLSDSLRSIGVGAFPSSVTEIHMPAGMEIEDTSIQWILVNDHEVNTYVSEGSWADLNLESWMNENDSTAAHLYVKQYE